MARFSIQKGTTKMHIQNMGLLLAVAGAIPLAMAQSTYSEILGTVTDPSGGAVADAKVTVKSLDTNIPNETSTATDGSFRVRQLAIGNYEVAIDKPGFARYKQGPIVLRLNQTANLSIKLEVSSTTETITVNADAVIINTTNAEVGTNFEAKRVSELPLAVNRNILNLALSVPGVSELSSGQTAFASGTVNFSVNGMRVRSNNFMIDGQDSNDPSVTGNQQTINNPDVVAEFRIITNQFLAEYGRAAGSVVSIVTKSGTNEPHGSAFWFYNGNKLNTLSNQEVNARVTQVPFLVENQFGGTIGGPVYIPKVYNGKNKTFFFTSLQKWSIRQQGFGTTLSGAPTQEGRGILERVATGRPQIQALLTYLPAAQVPTGRSVTLTAAGQTYSVPVGSITGSAALTQDNWQGSARGDHRFNDKHSLSMRYIVNDDLISGTGQVTPPGLTTISPARSQSAFIALNSTLSPSAFNEFRVSYQRVNTSSNASNSASEAIPSLEVAELGLVGINAATSRTAIGLAVNLPQFRRNNTYQVQNTTGIISGKHSIKFGIDFSRRDIISFFGPTARGSLSYDTLQRLYDDIATVATINAKLPGGDVIWPFKYYDYFGFVQDEWRLTSSLTLTYGMRYETAGPTWTGIYKVNERIVAASGGNPDFRMTPTPPRDLNNFAPRFGFNYRLPKLGWLTGDGATVLRGGYSRTYDHNFVNLTLNVASAFPFLNSVNFIQGGVATNAFATIQNARAVGVPANPRTANRTILSNDNRATVAEQFAFQLQREIAKDWAVTFGWIGTKGTGLFQTIDNNPIIPGSSPAQRLNTFLGVVRERCNCASSIYHSMQASLEKRLSRNFSMGAHYTWSSFIDDASELFNPNALADVAVPQDSFNRKIERGRSTFDRPHRFTANSVWEVPVFSDQKGFAGKVLGGWQVSPFLTFQSGAPFTPLNGADPAGRLAGISGLVGVAIRPMVVGNTDVSSANIEDLYRRWQGGERFFRQITAAEQIGNAGRGILRADGIGKLDIGFMKNTNITETMRLQLRADMFNVTNTRNFGIPDARVNSAAFLNQWNTDGGRRRIQIGARIVF
ncbi:MAG: TonB-dependent receptor [Bryobacterales bacterium]|nr:TonB-dependent receptor [Bryobacterales bacterium]